MAHNIEAMDVDGIDINFDNKENAFHHNSMLPITPSTEKGYEELDVSELNIKLRYSVTPTSSPMSKSFTVRSAENKDDQDYPNILYDNGNVTQTQNVMTQSDTTGKNSNLPLQLCNMDLVIDSNRNASVLRPLNATYAEDDTKIAHHCDDNISLPSSSSSLVHTPEATTPTKEVPKHDGGSPILRGIKTVLNMFRASKSPIPNSEDANNLLKSQNNLTDLNESKLKNNLASTPFRGQDVNDSETAKRSSPYKESMTFNDDLERELQWSDESSIYFDDEKIPIHKLIYQKPQICGNKNNITEQESQTLHDGNNLNETVEYMDISYNNSILSSKTITDRKDEKPYMTADSDNEFLDCETTFTKNEDTFNNKSNFQANVTNTLENQLSSDIEQAKQQDLNVTKEQKTLLTTEKQQETLDIKLMEIPFSLDIKNEQIAKLSETTSKNEELIQTETTENLNRDNGSEATQIQTKATENLNIGDNCSETTQLRNTLKHLHTVEVNLDSEVKSDQSLNNHPDSSDTMKIIVDNDQVNKMNKVIKDNAKFNLQSSIHEQALTEENIIVAETNNEKNIVEDILDSLLPFNVPLPDDDIDEKLLTEFNEIKNEYFSPTLNLSLNNENLPEISTIETLFLQKQDNNYSQNDIEETSELGQASTNNIVQECQTIELKKIEKKNKEESVNEENECAKTVNFLVNNLVVDIKAEEKTNLCDSQFLSTPDVISDTLVTINPVKLEQDSFSIIPEQSSVQVQANKTNNKYTFEHQMDREIVSLSDKVTDEVLNKVDGETKTAETNSPCLLEQINENDKCDSGQPIITNDMDTPETQVYKDKIVTLNQRLSDKVNKVDQEAVTPETNKLLEQMNSNKKGISHREINNDETVTLYSGIKQVSFPVIPEQTSVQVQVNRINDKCTLEHNMNKDKIVTLSDGVAIEVLDIVSGEPIKSENTHHYVLEQSNKTNDTGTQESQASIGKTLNVTDVFESKLDEKVISSECNNPYVLEQSNLTNKNESVQVNRTNDKCTLEHNMNKDEIVTLSDGVAIEVLDIVSGEPIKSENTHHYVLEQSNKTNDTGTQESQVTIGKTLNVTDVFESKLDDKAIISECNNPYVLEQSNLTNKNESAKLSHGATHAFLENVDETMHQTNETNNISTPEAHSIKDETASLNDSNTHDIVFEVNRKETIMERKLNASSPVAPLVEIIHESSIQLSPPIKSKGYNFNFDEIDDSFITNTRIEVTLPPVSDSVQSSKPATKTTLEKDAKRNRRSVQPTRKKITANLSKFNKTFDNKCYLEEKLLNDIDQEKPATSYYEQVPMSNETLSLTQIENKSFKTTKTLEDHLCVKDKNTNFNVNPSENEFLSEKPTKIDEIVVNNADFCADDDASSLLKDVSVKKVFNLPEIDDINFNPFSTKCKLTESVPDSNNLITGTSNLNVCEVTANIENCYPTGNTQGNNTETFNVDQYNKENTINTTCSSKESDDKDSTIREVCTEDEDTIEGPFLEANEVLEAAEKLTNFSSEKDMIRFSDVHQPPTAPDEGELFIDAQAYEFLMNQNANEVADSGKESLFLKFDPLFSRQVGSDGILKQNTPHKTSKSPDLHYNESFDITAVAASSTFNIANNNTITEENNDINITVSKPMMAVPPAVASNRNKASTPTRTNRLSMTFASPAIAMIDRLLSMSGNNLYVSQDTTTTTQENEADLALLQLREVLAEKEEQVLNLRIESEELKDRLANLESQMRALEAESDDRLKKVNELTEKLTDKTKMNKNMATLVEEYERTIASLITETEQEKKLHAEERLRLISERDEQTAHLASMEVSFSDLHSKYEKSKQMILGFKANEENYKKSLKEFEENYNKMLSNYELLKQHATSKLNHANQELEKIKKTHNAEVMKLNAMIKRKDLHITSLEETLTQKTKANEELTSICDELINKVG